MSPTQVVALFNATELILGRIIYLISLDYMESGYALPVTLDIGPLMSAELVSVPLNLDGKEVVIN